MATAIDTLSSGASSARDKSVDGGDGGGGCGVDEMIGSAMPIVGGWTGGGLVLVGADDTSGASVSANVITIGAAAVGFDGFDVAMSVGAVGAGEDGGAGGVGAVAMPIVGSDVDGGVAGSSGLAMSIAVSLVTTVRSGEIVSSTLRTGSFHQSRSSTSQSGQVSEAPMVSCSCAEASPLAAATSTGMRGCSELLSSSGAGGDSSMA